MRPGAALAATLALGLAVSAAAEPLIVDPAPVTVGKEEIDYDWRLDVEAIALSATPVNPSGLVFIGSKADRELLLIERSTGRVRRFLDPDVNDADLTLVEQALALDLAVDSCGERGLVGIALHPNFRNPIPIDPDDPTPPLQPPPDRVYLSYHTSPGRTDDGCGGGSPELRVERYFFDGSALVKDAAPADPPDPDDNTTFTPLVLPVTSESEVGGQVGAVGELDFDAAEVRTALYVLVGRQQRNGTLQNNRAVDPRVYDDSSVLIRLREDGSTPDDNPFVGQEKEFEDDPENRTPVTEDDRYFGYGFGATQGLTFDPIAGTPWLTEQGDGPTAENDGYDEINICIPATNGGNKPLQGFDLDKLAEDNEDEDYPLVDLVLLDEEGSEDDEFQSSYLNPRFSFEEDESETDFGLTGLAFGGTEVGPLHRDDLFVGTRDGRLFRFPLEPLRSGFSFLPGGSVLADTIADQADRDDPEVDGDQSRPKDDLTTILIGTGFGAITDLETGPDGSIFVLQQSGALHRVYSNLERDLAVVGLKVPAKITLSAKKPIVTKSLRVTLENQGEVAQRIEGRDVENLAENLEALLGITLTPLTGCAVPELEVLVPKAAQPPYDAVLGIAPFGGRLSLDVAVRWACDVPVLADDVPDFTTSVALDMRQVGVIEDPTELADNLCPRPPSGDDPGCQPKKSAVFGTDLIRK